MNPKQKEEVSYLLRALSIGVAAAGIVLVVLGWWFAPAQVITCRNIFTNTIVPCPVGMGGFPNVSVNYSIGLKIDAAVQRWSNAS